ncbi:hypothetical protein [Methylobacterium oxalidis]|uniref:hypothetical protein n=1 Tax=Methylobacterium oxalidis TaxID=944322 RepID=UPI0033162A17
MAKYVFHLSHAEHPTIRIEADDGFVIDDWTDLTAPSCLTTPSGNFKVFDGYSKFSAGGIESFRLIGKPFSSELDETGEAIIELFEPGCSNLGWRWKLVAKP